MSELTRDAGMVARYEIQCQSMSCHSSSVEAENRKTAAAYARNHGYRYIRGAWYCPEHANERRPNE